MSAKRQNSKFTCREELEGSKGAINALLFSDDGKLIISGGDDECIRLWDTESLSCEKTLHSEMWGQVTSLSWLHVDSPIDDKCVVLSVGSGRGCGTLSRLSKERLSLVWSGAKTFTIFDYNDAVEAQAFDRRNSRVAISSHSGQVKMFTFENASLSLKPLWTIDLNSTIPRAVFFFGMANQHVLTFGLESGEMCCRDATTSTVLWTKILKGGIGNVALSADQSTVIVDNLTANKFDVYMLPSDSPTTSLSFTSARRYPKQCTFLEGARVAVCGSDSNKVHVVDVAASECLQTLALGDGEGSEMVQTVAATNGYCDGAIIAGGSSTGRIFLWKREQKTEVAPPVSLAPNNTTQGQPNITYNPIDSRIAFLVIVLTSPNWSPYFWQFVVYLQAYISNLLAEPVGLNQVAPVIPTDTLSPVVPTL